MFRKTQLENGLRIVTEEVPSFHTVTLGFHVAVGSRFEEEHEAGYSHFIEHMLFKGTRRRTPIQIAREIEAVGGILNAFTAREYTSYYCKVLYENFEESVDLLTDIFVNSTFDQEELDREREVVKEEVRMVDDNPEDRVVELFYRHMFPSHPLGRSILGSTESLDALTRDSMLAYKEKHYRPNNIVIAAAGRVDHDRLVELVAKAFAGMNGTAKRDISLPAPMKHEAHVHHRATEQSHISIGTSTYAYGDPRRIPLLVLNTELGGGMGSRLFQKVREQKGLAYDVGSHACSFLDTGVLEIFLGTAQKNVCQAVDLCMNEVDQLRRNPLTTEDVQAVKRQLKGSLLMSLESSDSRMGRMARNEIYLNRFVSVTDLIEQIDQVTADAVQAVSDEILNPDRMLLTLLGDGDNSQLSRQFTLA